MKEILHYHIIYLKIKISSQVIYILHSIELQRDEQIIFVYLFNLSGLP